MANVVDQWMEEDYFTYLCVVLSNIGIDDERVEPCAHDILDAWTSPDGILNTDGLDEALQRGVFE